MQATFHFFSQGESEKKKVTASVSAFNVRLSSFELFAPVKLLFLLSSFLTRERQIWWKNVYTHTRGER